jgi:hypothetical protein
MNTRNCLPPCLVRFLTILALICLSQARGQVVINNVVPARDATGVSPSAAVVFTFSSAMDPDLTDAQFIDLTVTGFPTVVPVWSSGNTVLTCTPSPPFPGGHSIAWFVSGESTTGDQLSDFGSFTTSGSGGTGSGTNAITTFVVGKIHSYDQVSPAAPILDSLTPYGFAATTSLASNRTATSVTLTLPTSAVSNLTQNFVQHENYFLFASHTNLATFDATFPTGNYQFTVNSSSSNQTVNVNLPSSLLQPNAPHISNFAAAQTVNANQPFTLSWDAFSGGTTADFIFLDVGEVFVTAQPGAPGALAGTATSVQIPAGKLAANSNYDCSIGFYHALTTSNASYATIAYVATVTRFTLTTSAGTTSSLVLTNASWTPANFTFEVSCSPGQIVVVESSTTMLPGTWSGILTTNASGNRVRISDPRAATNRSLLYRARNGP